MPFMVIDLTFLGNLFPQIPTNIRLLISAIFVFLIFMTLIPALIAYFIFKIIGISGFRRLFSYEDRRSRIHKMHPLTKILLTFFVGIGVAVATQLYTLALLFLITIILWYKSNPSEDKLRLLSIMILTQWLLVAWGQSFLNPSFTSPLLTRIYVFPKPIRDVFGITAITLEGFNYGLFQGIRVATAMSIAILLITTTHPSQIIYGLKSIRLPMEINFMISTILRSIPEILQKSTLVLAAERARGLRIFPKPSGNIFAVIKDTMRAMVVVITAFIPVLIESIRAGRQLALAADVKAFRAFKDRTYYKYIPLVGLDRVLALLAGIGIVFLAVYPWLMIFFPTLPQI